MARFYTGKGDDGKTNLMGNFRVEKCDNLVEAIGEIDELNSVIGVAITNMSDDHLAKLLQGLQNNLFIIGAELAASMDPQASKNVLKSRITKIKIEELEKNVEELSATLPELKKFVLPGGSIGSSYLHLARSVCRRAERSVVAAKSEVKISEELLQYLNRLSSFLFVAALHLNKKEGIDEMNPAY